MVFMMAIGRAADVVKALEAIDFDTYENDDERRSILAASRQLTARLEKRWESVVHLTWATVSPRILQVLQTLC